MMCKWGLLWVKDFLRSIFLVLWGPSCVVCKSFLSEYAFLCAECTCKINPIVSHSLFVTEKKQVTVFAISPYKDPLKKLVLAKGFKNRFAARCLGELMWQKTAIAYQDFDYIVPIPLHWTRYAWRGYNQAKIMADVIASHSKRPVISFLIRKKRTVQQSFFTAQGRTLNTVDAFSINYRALKRISVETPPLTGKRIVLVDDLMTTGSTAKAAAALLFKAGALSVSVVVACRVP